MLTGWLSYPASAGSSASDQKSPAPEDDDILVVEPEQGNVLTHIISQLRPGADLGRVTLPTFILEPRSMLERITNFMCHPEMLLPIPEIDDPVQRFVSVVKFYLSGWHIRPPGVKKPLNPVLGEIFTCSWDLPDKSKAYYISEQTSHHPPKSSYFYMVPGHHIRVDGTLKPRSKFLGNSAASMMEGTAVLTLLNRGVDKTKGEKYILTQPNMYARGILFGKMKYELGDHSYVRCPELDLVADVEFKVKGWVGGTYNAIGGYVKRESTGEILYELSGLWSGEMFIRDVKTGVREMFFNALEAKPSNPLVRPIEEQGDRESQRLWQKTTQAVRDRDHDLATDEKTKVEDRQRRERESRLRDGVEWHPRLFRRVKGGPGGSEEGIEELEWIINAKIDGSTPGAVAEQIMNIYPIVEGQEFSQVNAIPPHKPGASSSESATGTSTEPAQDRDAETAPEGGYSPKEIQTMLSETGTAIQTDEPLLDLAGEVKK
ncbi:Oxysterol-binding protein [Sodiomyces alkalinus F11]|uniref:Oxysterol-binding protein n=1 Tax=Sodiomyces alkalinus (strain CBS 110278 / VKM F-3762 / F11) TaxID=1314773 RepID=A0A3N2PQL1_SODAK|nr:Oxysterol-binding protein [Sodiomyces alkalinus F11]ROT36765.1 Oxysterol-binding protein [Sodiomyces alkalinus F11]